MAATHEITHAAQHKVRGFPDRRLSYCNAYLTVGGSDVASSPESATCPACQRAISADIVRDSTGRVISRGGVMLASHTEEHKAKKSAAMKARPPRERGPLKPPPPPKVHYPGGCPVYFKAGALETNDQGAVTCARCIKQLEREG